MYVTVREIDNGTYETYLTTSKQSAEMMAVNHAMQYLTEQLRLTEKGWSERLGDLMAFYNRLMDASMVGVTEQFKVALEILNEGELDYAVEVAREH